MWKKVYLPAFKSFSEDKIPTLAAALSYYTIFSIAPILVLVILVIGIVLGNNESHDQIISQLNSALGSNATDLISNLISSSFNTQGQILAIFIGIVGLVLAITGLLDQMEIAFSMIWKNEIKRNLVQTIIHKFAQLAFVMLIAVVVLGSILLNNFVIGISGILPLIQDIASILIAVISIFVVVSLVFEFLITPKTRLKPVLVGAGTASLLLLVAQSLLTWYLSAFAGISAYGAAGSVVVILLWVYYVGQIILFSAKVTKLEQDNLENLPNSSTNQDKKADGQNIPKLNKKADTKTLKNTNTSKASPKIIAGLSLLVLLFTQFKKTPKK